MLRFDEEAARRTEAIYSTPDVVAHLTIDPTRDYQPLNGRRPVHNVLRQAYAMS